MLQRFSLLSLNFALSAYFICFLKNISEEKCSVVLLYGLTVIGLWYNGIRRLGLCIEGLANYPGGYNNLCKVKPGGLGTRLLSEVCCN